MNKVLFILVPLLLMGYLIVITLIPRTEPLMAEAGGKIINYQITVNKEESLPSNHMKGALNCKSCHACELPTKEEPCLFVCPRESMISTNLYPEEGPNVVVIDEMSENYLGVVFSHKMHSEMSKISGGCTGCHHYNTTGSVLNCRKCHDSVRKRDNVSVPDLKAAFHQQCVTCHEQWSHENGCNSQCHLQKNTDNEVRFQQTAASLRGKSHPIQTKPAKMIWETNYPNGKIVTFLHDEHVQLFKLNCVDCHSGDNCTKCHDLKNTKDYSSIAKIKKTEEEHHKPCNNCHYRDACQKCHQDREMLPFNHGRTTGWNLKWYHSKLTCSTCHGNDIPFKKLDNNCTSCHKNFTKGSFDHKLTGLILSEVHNEADCRDCHIDGNFAKAPVCSGCHDDKSFPTDLPGKRIKR